MYTRAALQDTHDRSQESLRALMAHGRTLTAEELHRSVDGFGYPTVHLQLHHIVTAQRYWLSVIEGGCNVDEDEDRFTTIDALDELRERVSGDVTAHLGGTTDEALNRRRPMTTWRGETHDFTPALILMRTFVHVYHHMGQVTALCRGFGKPAPPGLDFSLR